MESELSSVQPAQDKFFNTLCEDEVFRKIKTSLEHKILDVVGEKYGDFGAEKVSELLNITPKLLNENMI